ncbi:histone deacetylase 4-like isoform X2 [Styela clava]
MTKANKHHLLSGRISPSMDHKSLNQRDSDSPPPTTKNSNGFKDVHPEDRTFIGTFPRVGMAAELAGAAGAGIMSEEYQKLLKLRQQQFDEQVLANIQRQQQLQEHFRQFLQKQHEEQNAAKNHMRIAEEEMQQKHDLFGQVLNKDKSRESANASSAVKQHLQKFVIGRQKTKTYDGYPNNVVERKMLRWTPSLDSRNGVHDLAAPYPLLFDKRSTFPLRKTASEPNLKVKSRLRKVNTLDRRCSPLLPRHPIDNSRVDIANRIKQKILNNDQAGVDNSASNSAPNSGPSSPLSSNSNINNSSTTGSSSSIRGLGQLPTTGASETELPGYPFPLAMGLQPREIYASPSLPNISLGFSQNKSVDPNTMITGTPPSFLMYPPEAADLQRLVLGRTSSLPGPLMQQMYKLPGQMSEMDVAMRSYLLQQQQQSALLAAATEKDSSPGPIRTPHTRPHKALSRTHSAPTAPQIQHQILQKKRLEHNRLLMPGHKHAPHLISGMAAEAPYRPLATHREAAEHAESSKQNRTKKLAASPPPTHPAAISSTTVAALHSHLIKHNNKAIKSFPKQSDNKSSSPPTSRHTSMEHTQTTPEKSSRSVIVSTPQRTSSEDREDRDVIVVKQEAPDVSGDSVNALSPHLSHQRLAAMAVQDKSSDHTPIKPMPLQGRRSLLEGEMGHHRPLTRTQSSPAVSFSQKHKHKEYKYTTGLGYDSIMLQHGCACGDAHAEHAGRLKEVWSRLTNVGLTEKCETLEPRKATMEELQLAHTQEHTLRYGATSLARQQSVVPNKFIVLPCGGVGVDNGIDIDTVWNELATINAARMAVGLTVDLALSVAADELRNGFAVVRPPGHHAEKNLAMAFCYFNSVAIAARQLQRTYPDKIRRVLIVDWDVHHCNGTQDIFYDDDSVLVISVHRYDEGHFFPGTGAPEETGAGPGVGFNVNIGLTGGLEPPIGDAEYLSAFRSVVMPIAEEFNPDFVFISAGFSAADGHPSTLGGYKVSPQCFSYLTRLLSQLANGKVVMALEGGFELKPLADCVEICVRTLLSDSGETGDASVGQLPDSALKSIPCDNAVRSIHRISRFQERYWSRLKRMSAYTSITHAAYLGQEQEDRTVVALASLSVEHSKHMDSKAKLREVLTRSQASKSPKRDLMPEHEKEPKLTIVTDEADEMHGQNREEAMSAESSPLDVVGLSSPSSESPAASPIPSTAFVTSGVSRNMSQSSENQNASNAIKEEPMDQEDSPTAENNET